VFSLNQRRVVPAETQKTKYRAIFERNGIGSPTQADTNLRSAVLSSLSIIASGHHTPNRTAHLCSGLPKSEGLRQLPCGVDAWRVILFKTTTYASLRARTLISGSRRLVNRPCLGVALSLRYFSMGLGEYPQKTKN
jgi:hypothetical protein